MKQETTHHAAASDATRWRELPWLTAKGFCMGAADVVPGVSGGTMALILGIYVRLIDAVKSVDSKVLQAGLRGRWRLVLNRVHWRFLAMLLSGVFAAIIFFTRIVRLPALMNSHPEAVYGLFFGLILGSVWFVYRDSGITRSIDGLWIVLGAAVGLRIVTLVPGDTPDHPLFVFLTGAVAITAMILPGISGSFILLIMRKYEYIFSQFARLGNGFQETIAALLILLPFFLGMVAGIIVFSRLLSWFLHHHRVRTYLVLTGFMLGSLWVIWPWQERTFELVREKQRLTASHPVLPEFAASTFWWGLGMMIVGGTVVIILEMLGRKR